MLFKERILSDVIPVAIFHYAVGGSVHPITSKGRNVDMKVTFFENDIAIYHSSFLQ